MCNDNQHTLYILHELHFVQFIKNTWTTSISYNNV